MWFIRFVRGTENERPVGDGFWETKGTAPTRKGSTEKATMVKRCMLKFEPAMRREAQIVGRR